MQYCVRKLCWVFPAVMPHCTSSASKNEFFPHLLAAECWFSLALGFFTPWVLPSSHYSLQFSVCGRVLLFSLCTWMRPTVSIVSTSRRRKLVPSWRLQGLEALLAAASGRAATVAGRTTSAAVAFGPRAPPASDALTSNCYGQVTVVGQYHATRTANPYTSSELCLASLVWWPPMCLSYLA